MPLFNKNKNSTSNTSNGNLNLPYSNTTLVPVGATNSQLGGLAPAYGSAPIATSVGTTPYMAPTTVIPASVDTIGNTLGNTHITQPIITQPASQPLDQVKVQDTLPHRSHHVHGHHKHHDNGHHHHHHHNNGHHHHHHSSGHRHTRTRSNNQLNQLNQLNQPIQTTDTSLLPIPSDAIRTIRTDVATEETVMKPVIVDEVVRTDTITEVQPIITRHLDQYHVNHIEKHVYAPAAPPALTTFTAEPIIQEVVHPHLINEVQEVVHKEVPVVQVQTRQELIEEKIVMPTQHTYETVQSGLAQDFNFASNQDLSTGLQTNQYADKVDAKKFNNSGSVGTALF